MKDFIEYVYGDVEVLEEGIRANKVRYRDLCERLNERLKEESVISIIHRYWDSFKDMKCLGDCTYIHLEACLREFLLDALFSFYADVLRRRNREHNKKYYARLKYWYRNRDKRVKISIKALDFNNSDYSFQVKFPFVKDLWDIEGDFNKSSEGFENLEKALDDFYIQELKIERR